MSGIGGLYGGCVLKRGNGSAVNGFALGEEVLQGLGGCLSFSEPVDSLSVSVGCIGDSYFGCGILSKFYIDIK